MPTFCKKHMCYHSISTHSCPECDKEVQRARYLAKLDSVRKKLDELEEVLSQIK